MTPVMFIFGNSVRIFMAKLFDNNFKMRPSHSLSPGCVSRYIPCVFSVSDNVHSNEDEEEEDEYILF